MLALGLGSIWKMTMKNLENDHGLAHKYCITAVSYCIALHNNPKFHPVSSYFVPDKLHFRLLCTENYTEIFYGNMAIMISSRYLVMLAF